MSIRRLTGDYNTGSDLFPQKEQDGYRRRQRPHRHSRAGSALVGRALGAEPVRHRIMPQVAFNTPFQAGADGRCRSSTRNSRADGRSSRPSWPSRGPTASPAASASEPTAERWDEALAGNGGGLFLWLRPPCGSRGAAPAAALSSRACSAFSRAGASIFAPLQIGQVEDVDRALAISGDMGAVDRSPSIR